MKFSRCDSQTLAEKGVDAEVPDPITGQPSGAFLTLLGDDSKVFQAALEEITSRNKARGVNGLKDADQCELYSRCTIGWKGWEDEDGKEAKFSQEAVKAKYAELTYLAVFAGNFIATRRNYFPKP